MQKKKVSDVKIEKEVSKFTPKQKETFINFSALCVAWNKAPMDVLIEAMDDVVNKYLEKDKKENAKRKATKRK